MSDLKNKFDVLNLALNILHGLIKGSKYCYDASSTIYHGISILTGISKQVCGARDLSLFGSLKKQSYNL